MELSEKELHCVARLLQGLIFGKNKSMFDGCTFCKYQCADIKSPVMPQLFKTLERLYDVTGVDTRLGIIRRGDYLEKAPSQDEYDVSRFFVPYGKFLKNSNKTVQDFFYKRFNPPCEGA